MGEAQDLKDRIAAERRGIPFLVYRDDAGEQQICTLDPGRRMLTVGRDEGAELTLPWDERVSAVHAELEQVAGRWVVLDDGLSRNGTFVNGERVTSRRRLRDGDTLLFGSTAVKFHHPLGEPVAATVVDGEAISRASLSAAQLRVLVALCRPLEGSSYATPATNQQIAEELYLSVDAVKTHMRALFAKFEVGDLPQNQKRLKVAELAFRTGLVGKHDLERT